MPSHRLMALIASRLKEGALHTLDAHAYAASLFGDSIASNTLLLGYAYQLGLVPIRRRPSSRQSASTVRQLL